MTKYLWMIAQFKDIARIYQEEKGRGKPWWLSRRFIGALITCLSTIFIYLENYFSNSDYSIAGTQGIVGDDSIWTEVSKPAIYSIASAIYGLSMALSGTINRGEKHAIRRKRKNRVRKENGEESGNN